MTPEQTAAIRRAGQELVAHQIRVTFDIGVNPAKALAAAANAANSGRLAASGSLKLAAAAGLEQTGIGAPAGAALAAWGFWNLNSSRSALARGSQLWNEAFGESLYDAHWRNLMGVLPFGDRYDDPYEPTAIEFFRRETSNLELGDVLTKVGELSW